MNFYTPCPKCGHWGFYSHHCSACGYSNKYTWVWWVVVPIGLCFLSWVYSSIIGSTSAPITPTVHVSTETHVYWGPGNTMDTTNEAEETQFWQDVRPPDEAPMTPAAEAPMVSGCPSGCVSPPSGCIIKGNISIITQEKIYHLPSDVFYNQTVVNTSKGERWFCNELEAQANGWRHASQ